MSADPLLPVEVLAITWLNQYRGYAAVGDNDGVWVVLIHRRRGGGWWACPATGGSVNETVKRRLHKAAEPRALELGYDRRVCTQHRSLGCGLHTAMAVIQRLRAR